jgi:rSAM/selenodomain-associated transferase 2
LIKEIIISDGNSSDTTCEIASQFGVHISHNPVAGRAKQMNAGALHATGDFLYFLHADSFPPFNFIQQILHAHAKGFEAGCFRLRFDWDHWFLNVNAWFTRFNINAFRFGDQSLFITKELFHRIGGFKEDHLVMEDQEIACRICAHTEFSVLPDFVTTSARKYRMHGPFRMQGIFFYLYLAYLFGVSQERLIHIYRKLIHVSI